MAVGVVVRFGASSAVFALRNPRQALASRHIKWQSHVATFSGLGGVFNSQTGAAGAASCLVGVSGFCMVCIVMFFVKMGPLFEIPGTPEHSDPFFYPALL